MNLLHLNLTPAFPQVALLTTPHSPTESFLGKHSESGLSLYTIVPIKSHKKIRNYRIKKIAELVP